MPRSLERCKISLNLELLVSLNLPLIFCNKLLHYDQSLWPVAHSFVLFAMTDSSTIESNTSDKSETPVAVTEPQPSYVKLAMRNMVRKRGLSLKHFFLTTAGLLAFFVGVSYLTR